MQVNDMDIKKKIVQLPIIIFSALVPLIVYTKNVEFTKEWYHAFSGVKSFVDMYSYYKMVWILISFILALLIFLSFTKKIDYKEMLKPLINKILLAMMLIIILSTIFSEYKFIVYFGFIDRYEGAIVYFAYIFFVLYINNFINDIDDLKPIFYGILISSTVIAVIGIFQSYGYSFFETKFGQMLIIDSSVFSAVNNGGLGQTASASSTLYNANYMGSYMVLAIFLGLSALAYSKSKKANIVMCVYVLTMIFALVRSQSSAGMLGFVIGCLIALIFGFKYFVEKSRRNRGKIYAWVIVIIIGLGALISPQIKTEINGFSWHSDREVENIDFKFFGNRAEFYKDNHVLNVMFLKDRFIFILDGEELYRKKIELNDLSKQGKKDKNVLISINNKFIAKQFELVYKENINSLVVNLKPNFIIVLEATESGLNLRDFSGRPLKYEENIDSFKYFEGKEFFGSSRGYIWKRSIPLIKERLLLGSGADTFPLVFPQHDLIEKRKYMFRPYMFLDKPHNMFIQMGINFGGLYLALYIMAILVYFANSIWIYLKRKCILKKDLAGSMIFCAIVSYNITGIFNDSVVSVSPMYWTIFAIGILVNRINKNSIDNDGVLNE